MSGHTATPWTSKVYDTQVILYGPGKIQVLATSWHGSKRASYPLKAESLANAEYALIAINSHADLVKALEEIRDHWANQYDHPRKENEMYRGPYGIGVTDGHRACAIIATAALATLIARKVG